MRREWLVTNGLGGYASGTVAGINTRRYHGLLVAALTPPVARTLLVAKVDEQVDVGGRLFDLGANEYHDGTISPRGFVHLVGFGLEGTVPTWTFAVPGAVVEKTLWMERHANRTFVRYRLAPGSGPVELTIQPYVTARDYHALTKGDPQRRFDIGRVPSGIRVSPSPGVTCTLRLSGGIFELAPDWYWKFLYREERDRGLDCLEDLYVPGRFRARLAPGDVLLLAAAAEADEAPLPDPTDAYLSERARHDRLLQLAAHLPGDPLGIPEPGGLVRRLVLAADHFLVTGQTRRTVVAGYHWFTDWGRDTMVALPGLALATGRLEDAREILLSSASAVDQGMLPNRFPDDGTPPEYTSADAALWYLYAVHQYLERTSDRSLLAELYPVARDIVTHYRDGTRYGIRADPEDGLLEAGTPGSALTWMDARIAGRAVTPRCGKAVDLNALWYNALRLVGSWGRQLGDDPAPWDGAAAAVEASFIPRFHYDRGGYLYDVIAPDGVPDPALRPNQLLALALPHPLVHGSLARSILERVSRELLTPVGLRSLAPSDPAYRGHYAGGPQSRDEAYHQGTAWPWWFGPYMKALVRVTGDRTQARRLLAPFRGHLLEAGLGTISEIFDGDSPHEPRGCIAQAWSVGALLEAWEFLGGTGP